MHKLVSTVRNVHVPLWYMENTSAHSAPVEASWLESLALVQERIVSGRMYSSRSAL
jgi:hypothetical protein